MTPTNDTYNALVAAYHTYNEHFFCGRLPECLITVRKKKGAAGYFWGGVVTGPDGEKADEIALDIGLFRNQPVIKTLSTLAHEMVHLWQYHFGKPGAGKYHNRQWANEMLRVGLQPTDTGAEGGKETGPRMTHVIIPYGLFETVTGKYLADITLDWSVAEGTKSTKNPKQGKRQKYTCPDCGLIAYARHDAVLRCGEDDIELQGP